MDASNNIYIAGFTFNDALLIKYSPSGATLWSATFDNNGAVDQAYSMAISSDGSRIGVAGKSGNLFMALMYDANGNRLWANTSTTIYPANSVAFGPGNVSYFAAGVYLAQDPNPYQMTILKFDASGNQVWAKNYNAGDRATRIAVDLQGNVVATGVDSDTGYMDWMTIKTDSNGTLLWSRRYDGGRNNDDVARQRPEATGRSPEHAAEEPAAQAALEGAGRLEVAPSGLPPALAACLDSSLGEILASAELRAAAERAQLGIEPRNGREAQAEVPLEGARALARFDTVVRTAVERARQ